MKSILILTGTTDKAKSAVWLRKNGYSISEIGDVLRSFPFVFRTDELNLHQWVPFCGPDQMDSIRKMMAKGCLRESDLPSSDCGLSYEVNTDIPEDETKMVAERIAYLEEINAAYEWYLDQPDDVKRKIDMVSRGRQPS